ncbi:hypothetical protein TWF506_004114 [Arthrobotrys conoides]|uniref:Protein kinase domain-containing protein n=1 Tax=Arthrobotrys conoides TaxID=74498 RepID=A0AAN8NCD0_9PEZI
MTRRSRTKTKNPAYPREYLADPTVWPGINDDIKNFLDPHLNHESERYDHLAAAFNYTIQDRALCGDKGEVVELGVRVYEDMTVRILRKAFSIRGDFRGHQDAVTIGDPDKAFYKFTEDPNDMFEARFLVEWKTPWDLPTPKNIIEHFNKKRARGSMKDNVVKAISQVYGYMSFNNLMYGALCNYEALYLFRRTGDTSLQISPPFLYSDRGIRSPLAALTYICNQVIKEDYSYHHSSVAREPPGTRIFTLEDVEVDGTWDNDIKVPWTNMNLLLTRAVSKNIASIIAGEIMARPGIKFRYQKPAFFKVYDITQIPTLRSADAEIKAYNDLKSLQGEYIPRLYAAGTTWGRFLKFLILEDCGQEASDKDIDPTFWPQARRAIKALHKLGMIHGDVKLDNFAISDGIVKVIDLGLSRQGSLAEQAEELNELDRLKRTWDEEREAGLE